MTDARLVWDTWRRILADDALVAAVTRPHDGVPLPPGLGADERAIVAEYARLPNAAEVTVGMFRRRLPKNALSALKLTPLTRRVLFAGGLDVDAVAGEFVRSIGYRDDGPNLWRTAGDFVAFLGAMPAFAAPTWQDVITVDRAACGLVRRLGADPPEVWPDELAGRAAPASERDAYVATAAATVASTAHDLSSWLEDPWMFAPDAALAATPCHWLIYVPRADQPHVHAELSAHAARALSLLSETRTAAALAAALAGLPLARTLRLLDALLETGAITAVPA